jgi:hypothetical protein
VGNQGGNTSGSNETVSTRGTRHVARPTQETQTNSTTSSTEIKESDSTAEAQKNTSTTKNVEVASGSASESGRSGSVANNQRIEVSARRPLFSGQWGGTNNGAASIANALNGGVVGKPFAFGGTGVPGSQVGTTKAWALAPAQDGPAKQNPFAPDKNDSGGLGGGNPYAPSTPKGSNTAANSSMMNLGGPRSSNAYAPPPKKLDDPIVGSQKQSAVNPYSPDQGQASALDIGGRTESERSNGGVKDYGPPKESKSPLELGAKTESLGADTSQGSSSQMSSGRKVESSNAIEPTMSAVEPAVMKNAIQAYGKIAAKNVPSQIWQ